METALKEFILEHENDDTGKLLLSSARYPGLNMRLAASTIEARRKIKEKIPSWYLHPEIEYPLALSVEQGSSELTARYKQQFVHEGDQLCDITGGMGVDSYFLAIQAGAGTGSNGTLDYFERNPELFPVSMRNFRTLGAQNIHGENAEVTAELLHHLAERGRYYDLIYADPARRATGGSRIYSIADCEPNILELKTALFQVTDHLLIKVSPMADLSRSLQEIPEIREIHVIACGNECKEVLLFLEKGYINDGDADIVTANLNNQKKEIFRYRFLSEKEAQPRFDILGKDELKGAYLYDPNKAILKAGAFRSISEKFGISKLAQATHLYCSRTYLPEFPGRVFKIEEAVELNKTHIKTFRDNYPASSVTAKNIPMTSDELRKKLKVRESDSLHTFGTSLLSGEKVLIIGRRV